MSRWYAPAFALLVAACTPTGGKPAPDAGATAAAPPPLHPAELETKLRQALADKGPSYAPRTRHKNADGSPRFVNRLLLETSPYLLQHAHNPVDWFPWSDDAFALAKKLGRPVFLSIGYATCHWCHVMEEESFEDLEVAAYLNEHYLCIKVDREARPDVDAVYMQALILLTGNGGWPMSVWLTHDRRPFYAGSYFPPRDGDRGAGKGFLTLLGEQEQAFARDPERIANNAARLAERIHDDLAAPAATDLPKAALMQRATALAARGYDEEHGGMLGAPKFPSNWPIRVVLRTAARAGDEAAKKMALATLRRMAAGGIRDQLGGGFHRYATDTAWLVPHFEKMLYDQAELAVAYLEGYQASGDETLAAVARGILDDSLRTLAATGGGFYSATDADSPAPSGKREEGWYFTWTPAEIDAALPPDDARAFAAFYGVTAHGNFAGRSVLSAAKPQGEVARALSVEATALDQRLAGARKELLAVRAGRPEPLRDEAIIVSNNGLMIGALARAGRVLGEARYLDAARQSAAFLLEMMSDGGLRHVFSGGRASGRALAEDHALFAAGLVDLFEATQEKRWLDAAFAEMDRLERDHGGKGGYFRTANGGEALLAREVEDRDGVVPSASSAAALTALRLYALTGDVVWRDRAATVLRAFDSRLEERPLSLDALLLALDFFSDSPKEIVIALPDGAAPEAAAKLTAALARSFVPNAVLVIGDAKSLAALGPRVPLGEGKTAQRGKPTAYVCEHGACQLPTSDPTVFVKQLAKYRPYPK